MRVGRKCLPFREPVSIRAQIPQQMFFGNVAKPFDAVGKNRKHGVTERCSFISPACIPDHDFIQGNTFFGSTDNDISPNFGYRDHDLSLAEQPFLGRNVVEDANAPTYLSIRIENASE